MFGQLFLAFRPCLVRMQCDTILKSYDQNHRHTRCWWMIHCAPKMEK